MMISDPHAQARWVCDTTGVGLVTQNTGCIMHRL